MKNVKIGIVGIGNMGSAHLKCIMNGEINGMTVTAVCDCDESRIEEVKKFYSELPCYTNYDKMLANADIDAVLIATPHPLHVDMAIAALKSGRHILVEKPIDITFSAAELLNEQVQKSGKIFGIMFNQRTNTLFAKAREIVQNGVLGEITRSDFIITNWFRTQRYYDSGSWRATWVGEGGGVLLNQAPHQLDLWQWICGMPESVTAFCNVAKYHNIEVEDEATIYTTYKNGATGRFITTTGEYPGTNRLEIVGMLGKIVIENGILKLWKLKESSELVSAFSKENSCEIECEYTEYDCYEESGHRGILQNFANAVLNGEELIAPGTDGIKELLISNAAYLSEWSGNTKITLPLGDKFDSILNEKINKSKSRKLQSKKDFAEYSPRWRVRW